MSELPSLTLVWWASLLGSFAAAVCFVMFLIYLHPEFISLLRTHPIPGNILINKENHIHLNQNINAYRACDPEQPYMAWTQRWPAQHLIRRYEFLDSNTVPANSPKAYQEAYRHASAHPVPFRRLIGEGLVFAEGDTHRAQRRALGSLFITRHIRSYVPGMNNKSLRLVQEVDRAARGPGKVETNRLFSKMTLDIIGLLVFGIDLGDFKLRDDFAQCYASLFDRTQYGTLLADRNLVVPIRWLPGHNQKFMSASVRLRQIMTEITDRRIRAMQDAQRSGNLYDNEGRLRRNDMLTYLVETRYLTKNDPWSKADIVEQALNFLATGHETTAGALTFAVHLLFQHPRVVCKIRAEARTASIFAGNFNLNDELGGGPSFNQIDSLSFLDNVVKECLRLLPPVASIPRVATKNLVVDGKFIPKGTTLMPVPAVPHHDPAIWGPDANEFRPERWEKLAGHTADAAHNAWMGFGHGARACIERALAELNVKIVILQLAIRFDFRPVRPGKVPVVNPSGQLRPRGDMWMQVRRANTQFGFNRKTNQYYCL